MDLNRNNLKRIRGLILFTAVVCLAVIKIDRVLNGFFFHRDIKTLYLWRGGGICTEYSHERDREEAVREWKKFENTEGKKAGEHIPCFHIGDTDHGGSHRNGSAPADKDDDGVGE